jgi:hypothetical protein
MPRRARECSTQPGQNATPFFGVPVGGGARSWAALTSVRAGLRELKMTPNTKLSPRGCSRALEPPFQTHPWLRGSP